MDTLSSFSPNENGCGQERHHTIKVKTRRCTSQGKRSTSTIQVFLKTDPQLKADADPDSGSCSMYAKISDFLSRLNSKLRTLINKASGFSCFKKGRYLPVPV